MECYIIDPSQFVIGCVIVRSLGDLQEKREMTISHPLINRDSRTENGAGRPPDGTILAVIA